MKKYEFTLISGQKITLPEGSFYVIGLDIYNIYTDKILGSSNYYPEEVKDEYRKTDN